MLKAALALVLFLPGLAQAQEAILLVRHGQKADASDDPPLSAAGEARARALAKHMKLAGLTAIYASDRQRTQLTAAPTAEALALRVNVHPAKDAAGLVARLAKEQPRGRVLVVGHSNTLPAIVAALGIKEKVEIGDDDFDNLFVIVPRERGGPLLLRLRW
jgi:broad specificity phosphatase PhoE